MNLNSQAGVQARRTTHVQILLLSCGVHGGIVRLCSLQGVNDKLPIFHIIVVIVKVVVIAVILCLTAPLLKFHGQRTHVTTWSNQPHT